jgi:hypothetical protein
MDRGKWCVERIFALARTSGREASDGGGASTLYRRERLRDPGG